MEMNADLKSKKIDLEKHFQEFSPYLSSVVMDSLNKRTGKQVPLDKSNLIDYLNDQCREKPENAYRVKEALFNVFEPEKVKEPTVMRKIWDINLLYCLKFLFPKSPLKIDSKVTGRALELVVESVLKCKLKNSKRFDYEFVDWKAFDYMILDKNRNDWIVGIQCKTVLAGGILSYQKEIKKLKDLTKNFPEGKTFVMFCGCTNKSKKEETKAAFEREGWKFYYLWMDNTSYEIDKSFYEFMDLIVEITKE